MIVEMKSGGELGVIFKKKIRSTRGISKKRIFFRCTRRHKIILWMPAWAVSHKINKKSKTTLFYLLLNAS
jgi:hypothetical protein